MGPQYCLPYATDLVFSKTIAGVRHGELTVTDVNSKPLFWFDGSSKNNRWFLVDANSSSPLISIKRKKSWSCYDRWQVFRGASKKKRDLLFKMKRSSSFGFNTWWRVNLAANKTRENKYDFKIKGGYKKRSIKIYKGDTSIVVAQMRKEHKFVNLPWDKHAFVVNINPYTDHAFIVSLIVILHLHHLPKEVDSAMPEVIDAIFQVLQAASSSANH
ncbi:LURP-one-related protein [Dioscorea alata]|uniref:LURP-one-related protein n=1 Tax=Dioscorea alata TaxID=55571 RepID=A0ACB7V2T0_DIOAL|nr:LURP-one-related protein [Dioscorea alata]